MSKDAKPLVARGLRCGPGLFWGALVFVPLLREGEPSTLAVRMHGDESTPEGATHALLLHGLALDAVPEKKQLKVVYGTQVHGARPFQSARVDTLQVRCPTASVGAFVPDWLLRDLFYCRLIDAGFRDCVLVASGTERGTRPALEREAERREELRRLLEPLPTQVGVLVYAAGTLLSGMVLPRPQDWNKLHAEVLGTLWNGTVERYGLSFQQGNRQLERMPEGLVRAAIDLPAVVSEWQEKLRSVRKPEPTLLTMPLRETRISRENYLFRRFFPTAADTGERYAGEALYNSNNVLEYLFLEALDNADASRLFALQDLRIAGWEVRQKALSRTLNSALTSADLGYLARTERQRG